MSHFRGGSSRRHRAILHHLEANGHIFLCAMDRARNAAGFCFRF
jgi:hypothetical protein